MVMVAKQMQIVYLGFAIQILSYVQMYNVLLLKYKGLIVTELIVLLQ